MNIAKWTMLISLAMVSASCQSSCKRDAEVASYNLSYKADNFELDRRVVFYNGITGEYMLEIRGKCSLSDSGRNVTVTCMVGPKDFKKHYLGLSDNVTYFAEQMTGTNVSRYHYTVAFKPQAIIPDIDFRGDAKALKRAVTTDGSD